jgi:hypothetical protein
MRDLNQKYIQADDDGFRNPKISFEGNIRADYIIEVIFRKEILRSGYSAYIPDHTA